MSSNLAYAWRDYEYFENLSEEEKLGIPASPVGGFKIALVDESIKPTASTFIAPGGSCSTFISDCCSTFISPGASCSTFVGDCCG